MSQPDLRAFLEDLKERAPIEEIVRARLGDELKRQGSLWGACCPFHAEKTPSFKVDPRRQRWHCFGACGEGGDAINFVQRFDNVEFREAVEVVAGFAGMAIPDGLWRRDTRGDARRDRLLEVLARAEEVYGRLLFGRDGAGAREYLSGRGLARETCEAFGIGWSPTGNSPILDLAKVEGWPFELVEEAGLVRRKEADERGPAREYDFFHGRLMIPIRDLRGRTVGFGARRLGGGDARGPKYVNSPETELFKKSRLVYGLDRAQTEVRRGKHLVLVEGYTDVMAAHQVGLRHVGAVLGTATTEDHAALVRRSGARRITLVFDGDEAGRAAAMKALHGLLPLGLALDVATLPAGADPCDLCVQHGTAGLEEPIAAARDWFAFLLAGLEGLAGAELAAAVDPLLTCAERVASPVERDLRLQELATHLSLPEEGLRARLAELVARARPGSASPAAPRAGARPRDEPGAGAAAPPPSEGDGHVPGVPEAAAPGAGAGRPVRSGRRGPDPERDERLLREAYAHLVGACLLDPGLLPAHGERLADCPDEGLRAVVEALAGLRAGPAGAGPPTPEAVQEALGDARAASWVPDLVQEARKADSAGALAEGAVRFLDERARARELESTSRALAEAADWEREQEVLRGLDARLLGRENPVRSAESPSEGGPAPGPSGTRPASTPSPNTSPSPAQERPERSDPEPTHDIEPAPRPPQAHPGWGATADWGTGS